MTNLIAQQNQLERIWHFLIFVGHSTQNMNIKVERQKWQVVGFTRLQCESCHIAERPLILSTCILHSAECYFGLSPYTEFVTRLDLQSVLRVFNTECRVYYMTLHCC